MHLKMGLVSPTDSHPRGLFPLVALAPILRPSHPRRYFARGLVSLPIGCAGAFPAHIRPAVRPLVSWSQRAPFLLSPPERRVCGRGRRRRLFGIGSAFGNICLFSDLGGFICGLVRSPFLFTGLDRFFLCERRRRRKCKARENKGRAHNKPQSFVHRLTPILSRD